MSRRCRCTCFHLAVAENLFKQHPLVGHVLVDDPEPVFAGGEDERIPQLAQRPERAELVQGPGGLLGLDLGGCPGGIVLISR